MTVDARTAIRRAIARTEEAEKHLHRGFIVDGNAAAAAHAQVAQAWAAIAAELTLQEIQLPGPDDAIDQAERGDR